MPCFPVKIWNCYQRVLNDEETTNNSLEAWHQQFELDCGKHKTLNKLIEQLRLEQKNTDILVSQLLAGDQYVKRKKNLLSAAALKKYVLTYNKENLQDYLNNIILLI